jgi:hypothetical protein
MMPHLHVTDASAIFTASSLIGLYYSLGILPRYIATYRATRRVKDAASRSLSEGIHFEIMVGEIIRGTIHTIFLIAGVWSTLLVPDPIPPGESRGHLSFGAYFLWALVAANVGITINTLVVRRGYRRRRGEGPAKIMPTRDSVAHLMHRVRRLEKRVGAEERRNDAIEARADAIHARADLTDLEQVEQNTRIGTVEEVIEVKHTIKTTEHDEP